MINSYYINSIFYQRIYKITDVQHYLRFYQRFLQFSDQYIQIILFSINQTAFVKILSLTQYVSAKNITFSHHRIDIIKLLSKIKKHKLKISIISKNKDDSALQAIIILKTQETKYLFINYRFIPLELVQQSKRQSFAQLIYFLENSIPKPNSVLNGVARTLDDVFEFGVVFVSEVGDQMGCFGTVETSVKLDVSVQVPLQSRAIDLIIIQGFDDLAEHLGNWILTTEEELACSVGDGSEDGLARILVELLHIVRVVSSIDSLLNMLISVLIFSHFGDFVDIVLHWLRIGSNLLHSLHIELKMGEVLTIDIGVVSLLSDDDFVDEPGSIDVCAWSPESSRVGDVPLEVLNEKEEIPNSEAVSLHEEFGGLNGVDCSIQRMRVESGLVLLEDWVVEGIGFLHMI